MSRRRRSSIAAVSCGAPRAKPVAPNSRPSGATSRPKADAFIHGQRPWPSAAGVSGVQFKSRPIMKNRNEEVSLMKQNLQSFSISFLIKFRKDG
jgi:hypothetical protein